MERSSDIEGFEFVSREPTTEIHRHVRTQVLFRRLPGGTVRRGLSEDEAEALRRSLIDKGGQDSEAGLDFLDSASELRPKAEVAIAPFLLATEPLTRSHLMAILGADAPQELGHMPGCVTLSIAARVSILLDSHGLRLPSEAEWEYTYRAGARDPFPWGTELPGSPWAPENRFGFEGMGEFAELCADGWQAGHEGAPLDGSVRFPDGRPRVARGGAAEVWPWQDVAEWVTLLSAYRSSSSEHDGFLRIRPACSLG
jgi:hypothetical protein